MRQAVAPLKKSKGSDQVRGTKEDLKSQAQAVAVTSSDENLFAANFVIGALLFWLLGSHRNETIKGLLPDGDQN